LAADLPLKLEAALEIDAISVNLSLPPKNVSLSELL